MGGSARGGVGVAGGGLGGGGVRWAGGVSRAGHRPGHRAIPVPHAVLGRHGTAGVRATGPPWLRR